MFERRVVSDVMQGLQRTKKLLHIIVGPRQVGKTTAAQQIADKWPGEVLTFSADSPIPRVRNGSRATGTVPSGWRNPKKEKMMFS